METTFQERMQLAIERAGGQSALARKINERYGGKSSQQTIQYLQRTTLKKPAQGSKLIAQIAGIAGLGAEWLASGKGQKEESPAHGVENKATHTEFGPVEVVVKETGKKIWMELSQQAIEVAALFMDLNRMERDRFHRAIIEEHKRHVEAAPKKHHPSAPPAHGGRKVIALKRKPGTT